MIPTIISVDPGISGVAVLMVKGDPVDSMPLPYRDIPFSKSINKILDSHSFTLNLEAMLKRNGKAVDAFVLERPIALPTNAVTSTATSFMSFGAIIASLDHFDVDINLIEAKTWVTGLHKMLMGNAMYESDNTKTKTKYCFKILYPKLDKTNEAFRDASCQGFFWLYSNGYLKTK